MEARVYRLVTAVLLCSGAASPAPQDPSVITYVRPLAEAQAPGPGAGRESRVENLPLVIGGAFNDTRSDVEQVFVDSQGDVSTPSIIRVTREDATTSSEADVPASTDRSADEVTEPAEPAEPVEATERAERPRFPSPRFTSKLSYFHKASVGAPESNLVERTGNRKFRSRCRCEKIWNCPKLQITVPRCPEEYFMCCF